MNSGPLRGDHATVVSKGIGRMALISSENVGIIGRLSRRRMILKI